MKEIQSLDEIKSLISKRYTGNIGRKTMYNVLFADDIEYLMKNLKRHDDLRFIGIAHSPSKKYSNVFYDLAFVFEDSYDFSLSWFHYGYRHLVKLLLSSEINKFEKIRIQDYEDLEKNCVKRVEEMFDVKLICLSGLYSLYDITDYYSGDYVTPEEFEYIKKTLNDKRSVELFLRDLKKGNKIKNNGKITTLVDFSEDSLELKYDDCDYTSYVMGDLSSIAKENGY